MDNTTQSNNYSSREITHTVDLCDYLRTIPGMKAKTFDLINNFMQPHDANTREDPLSSFAYEANAIWEACMGCPEVPDVHFDEPNKGYAIKGRVNPFKRLAYRTKSVDCSEHGQNNIPIISDEFGITDSESRKIITPLWRHKSTQRLAPLLTLILLRNYTDEKRLCFRVSKKGVTNTCCRDVVADYLSEITPKARYAYTCEKRKSDPLLFSPYMLDIEFWTLICELKTLYEMAKQNLAIRESRNGQALPWDLQEQAVLFSLYNCNPFDILIDWLKTTKKTPPFACGKNFETYLYLSLAPLFSEGLESSDLFQRRQHQFTTKYYRERERTATCNEISANIFYNVKLRLIQFKNKCPPADLHSSWHEIGPLFTDLSFSFYTDDPLLDEPGSAQYFIRNAKRRAGKGEFTTHISECIDQVLNFRYTSAAYFMNLFQDTNYSIDSAFQKIATHFFLESQYISTLNNDYVPMAKGFLRCLYYLTDDNILYPPRFIPTDETSAEKFKPFNFYRTDQMSSASRTFRRSKLLQKDCSSLDFSDETTLDSSSKRLANSYYYALDALRHTDEGLQICIRCQSYLSLGWRPIWFVVHQFELY